MAQNYKDYREEQRKKRQEEARRKAKSGLKNAPNFLKSLFNPQKTMFETQQAEEGLYKEEENKSLEPQITADNTEAFLSKKKEDEPIEVEDTKAIELRLATEKAQELGISLEEALLEIGKTDIARAQASGGTSLSQARQIQTQQQSQLYGSQIGQYNELGVEPTGFDYERGIISGLRDAIPRAISFAGAGAVGGGIGVGAATGGVGAPVGAIIGGVAGFTAGIVSSLFSDFKSQRTENINDQKRTLDEGKPVLNDWITLAASSPTDRGVAISQFNKQLARIDQAYRQMKLDTSRDTLKFESAIPDLAEFEEFYSFGGERDALIAEMKIALGVQNDPEYIYRMAELAHRKS